MMRKPKIRFKGYNEDWEQRKLGETCSRVQGNDGRMELPTLTISAANGWMKQEDRFSGNIAGKEQKNYTLLHKGELSYNHGNSKLAKYGTVFSLQTYEEALVPRVYHSFKVESGSADFIEYYFATKMPDRELRKLISSGARMDGLLNIGYDDFMGIKMMFPSTLEQDKIAEYFRALDHLITLHHRKCVVLRKKKVNDWEQRKLGKVLKERTERAEGNEELLSVTISNGVIRQVDSDKRNIASEDKSNYKIVCKGDIAYNSMRMWQGAVGNSEYDGIVSPAYTVLVPTEEANSKFFMELFKKESSLQIFQRWSQGLTSDTWNLKYPVLSSIQFCMPSVEEQVKIGEYFSNLDHLITLHQHKCDELQNLKKYMLQNMFV